MQNGITINGQNPLRNREIEREELKRASISQISGQKFDQVLVGLSLLPHQKRATPKEAAQI